MDVNGDFTCIPTTLGIGKMKKHPHQGNVNGDFTCIPTTLGIGKMKKHPHQGNDFKVVMEVVVKFQHNIENIHPYIVDYSIFTWQRLAKGRVEDEQSCE